MATVTKNHTSEKPDVDALQRSRTPVPDNLSTEPNNNPSSTNSSKLSSPASPQQNASGDLTDVGAALTGGEDSKDGASQAAVSASGGAGPATDVEKKLRRAERFGVPVKLSEQEKRSSRAERFGSGSGSGSGLGPDPSKSLEDQKRKARAERFGLAPTSVPNDESKKKARLARFGSDIKADTKADTLEEEKRKARALRFAQPSAGSLSHLNGEGNKTTVASKAVGGT